MPYHIPGSTEKGGHSSCTSVLCIGSYPLPHRSTPWQNVGIERERIGFLAHQIRDIMRSYPGIDIFPMLSYPGCHHGCILPGLGTYHFSPILLPTRKSGTIRHLENGGNQNFTEAFVTLIVRM